MTIRGELEERLIALRDRGDITSGYDTAVECLAILAKYPDTESGDEREALVNFLISEEPRRAVTRMDPGALADALLAAGYRNSPAQVVTAEQFDDVVMEIVGPDADFEEQDSVSDLIMGAIRAAGIEVAP